MRRLCLFSALLLSGCQLLPGGPSSQQAATQPAAAGPLRPGEGVRIVVAGERELSGIFAVAANGTVHLELLGDVMAAGLTPGGLAAELRQRLAAGYLKRPEVTVVRADAPAQPAPVQPAPLPAQAAAGPSSPPALAGSLAESAPPLPPPPPVLRSSQDMAPF
jgi:hypothetical protein